MALKPGDIERVCAELGIPMAQHDDPIYQRGPSFFFISLRGRSDEEDESSQRRPKDEAADAADRERDDG